MVRLGIIEDGFVVSPAKQAGGDHLVDGVQGQNQRTAGILKAIKQ